MTNLSIIENKVSAVKKYLAILKKYRKFSRTQVEKDTDIKGMVERYLYLMAQATIDLADSIIAFKNFRKPTTLSESFYILNEEDIISDNLTERIVKMAGFRNVLAHDYEKIDYDIIYNVLQKDYQDVEEFIKSIRKKLNL